MDTLDCIKARRSVRKYHERRVETDKLGLVLDAARFAPSAGNLQSWRFIVVEDEKKRHEIAEGCAQQYWMAKAPVHIVVCSDPTRTKQFYGDRGEKLYTLQECAGVISVMLLAASELGLGSCWVGALDEDMIRRVCAVPDHAKPIAVITLGYAAEKPQAPPRYSIHDTVFFESYNNKLRDPEISELEISMAMEKGLKHHATHVKKKAESVLDKIREKTGHFG